MLETTARFAFQGRGTPAPWAPPERFVERGSYRFVRSPMYLGVLLLVVGQALLLGREILFAWAVGRVADLQLVARHRRRSRASAAGSATSYDDYRRRVRRWIPTRPRSPRY